MKLLDSQRFGATPIFGGGAVRFERDIGHKVAKMTGRHVCESHWINVYGRFANALDECVTQERQVNVASHVEKEEGASANCQLSAVEGC